MEKPTFKEALSFWTKLGFISFGGPAGQVAIMHEFLVEKKKWISDSKFLHALNYCMVLPGPEAQQLATYYFGKAVVFPKVFSFAAVDYVSLGWTIISFIAIYRYKIGMIAWIGISAVFGLLYFFVTH
jgi:chromate transporter